MPSLPETYSTRAHELLVHAQAKNAPTIARLAPIIGASVARGGILHTFGSGHSDVIAREIIGRAGGLVCVNGIAIAPRWLTGFCGAPIEYVPQGRGPTPRTFCIS